MGSSEKDKSELELCVFNSFVEAASIPIIPGSIKKVGPPAPDILCEHKTEGKIAFELVELIYEKHAHKVGQQATFQCLLQNAHDTLKGKKVFDKRFKNADIHIAFCGGVTKNKLMNSLHDIFEELRLIEPDFEGERKCFENRQVKKIVKSISISRGKFNGPIFSIKCVSSKGNPVVKGIKCKLKKSYQSEFPIELLGYFTFSGSMPKQMWWNETKNFVEVLDKEQMGNFRKIWIFNVIKEEIECEFPENVSTE